MGIRAIRGADTPPPPNFTYQNMVKNIAHTSFAKDYEVVGTLGKGAYAQVEKAKSRVTGQLRAVKIIDRKKHSKIEPLLLNEFDILKQLDHPNVLKMYHIYEEFNYYYIVTELCYGRELFDELKEVKHFSEPEAAAIFIQIVSACRYLHSRKVMHRDLKPENIFYDRERKILKLLDFGSAVWYESAEPTRRRVVGTSYYVAPEVLDKVYNHKCDVWSAGIILYILLSGEPPFKGENDDKVLAEVKKGEYHFKKPIWGSISPEAKMLITEMLQKDPQQRPEMEKVLESEWVKRNTPKSILSSESEKSMKGFLSNMQRLQETKTSGIQTGVLVFIVNFIKNPSDEVEIAKCFKELDLNGDGVISPEELSIGLSRFLKIPQKEAVSMSKAIFAKIDTNNSGFIDYSEFLVSAGNIEMTVSEQNLQMAFNYMDEDGNGSLSAHEIRQKLGDNISEESYVELLKEFKLNKKNEINKEDFVAMMRRLIQKK